MKKMIIIGFILLMVLLTGCGAVDENGEKVKSTNRFYATDKMTIDGYYFYSLTDSETNCQYLISVGSGTSIEPLDGIKECEK